MDSAEDSSGWREAAAAVGVLIPGIVLVAAGSALRSNLGRTGSQKAPDYADLLGAAAAAVGLCVLVWWLLSLLLGFVSIVLERTGHQTQAKRTSRLTPQFMKGLAGAVLGLNLLAAPMANASSLPPDPTWSTASPAQAERVDHPSALWKAGPSPAPGLPEDSPVNAAAPAWRPQPAPPPPGLLAPEAGRSTVGPLGVEPVVVRPGDSLWTIAARRLGPLATDVEIARSWPRWHEANRSLIGPDPNLVLPGQILTPPPDL